MRFAADAGGDTVDHSTPDDRVGAVKLGNACWRLIDEIFLAAAAEEDKNATVA